MIFYNFLKNVLQNKKMCDTIIMKTKTFNCHQLHDVKLQNKMLKKYIVTIMCDVTQIQIVLKSKLTKQQLYDVLCKMYDDFDLCEINETTLIFDFSYVVTNTLTHEQLKRCYYANNKCC